MREIASVPSLGYHPQFRYVAYEKNRPVPCEFSRTFSPAQNASGDRKMQVRRLLEIILLLLHGRCGTLRELSEHCFVSVDAIKNDIGILKNSGIPIRCCSASGTLSLPEGFTLETMFKPRRERSAEMSCVPPLPDGGGYPALRILRNTVTWRRERKRNELAPGRIRLRGLQFLQLRRHRL